ncbi:hypothetical protein Glove_520g6 [Diversispora epigaea]|uniref:Protein kinase domain-containing protein n=1 Tax=Diversispora epigaea TaxID=1348612 RepID=A0A397GIE7_9GLOM|nr:hypothetical protein Glove_520g6 [Diversispora epigaea]
MLVTFNFDYEITFRVITKMFLAKFYTQILTLTLTLTNIDHYASDVYSYEIIDYEIVTGFPPYSDIPHNKDLALKICNGLRPIIPFRIQKLITGIIIQPKINQYNNETPLNYQTHPQAIYTKNFEKELEELTKSMPGASINKIAKGGFGTIWKINNGKERINKKSDEEVSKTIE